MGRKKKIQTKNSKNPSLISCPQDGCDGVVSFYYKNNHYYGTCDKCGCGFGTVLVRRGEKCNA